MPYVAPTTVSTGDVLTASRYNSDVVGNVIDLRSYQNRYASYRYTSGSITLTGTSTWSTLTTIGTAGDLTVNASSGDVIEAGVFALAGNQAVDLAFDPVTIVSATVTNSFGMAGAAPANWAAFNSSGWYCPASALQMVTGTIPYTLAAGDISSGTVTVRLRYAMNTGTNRTLNASTSNPFMWWIRNLGPVTT